jgi:hypothetical protein
MEEEALPGLRRERWSCDLREAGSERVAEFRGMRGVARKERLFWFSALLVMSFNCAALRYGSFITYGQLGLLREENTRARNL